MNTLTKGWTKEEIAKWYDECVTDQSHIVIEFSTDSGRSWVTFRHSRSELEDVSRIYTLLQRGNIVRDRKVEKVTIGNQMGFFNSVAIADTKTAEPVRKSRDRVFVYRTDGGAYHFTPPVVANFAQYDGPGQLITTIDRTTYYDAYTPNDNVIVGTIANEPGPMRRQGFVFRIMLATKDVHIAHWWPIIASAHLEFKNEDWVSVRCARHFDDQLEPIFRDLGSIFAVIGNKYLWGWNKRNKLGDTWIIHKDNWPTLVKRLVAAGMAIEPEATEQPVETVTGISFTPDQVNPEYIMAIRKQLEQLVVIGNKSELTESLIKIIEFRNKCVDELTELNKVINLAREVIHG